MNKTLKTIQTFAKIGKVISTIIFVFSIIGAVVTLIALSAIVGLKDVQLEGRTFADILSETGVNFVTMIFSCAISILSCIASAVVSKFAEIYFTNELELGTPFTFDGAKELLRLGIIATAIPAGLSVISGIAFTITKLFYPHLDGSATSFDTVSIGIGIMLIILAFFCKHGAELADELQEAKGNK